MTKEKKEILDFTDIIYFKLKFHHKSKSKRYNIFNVGTDEIDSIYSSLFEDSATVGSLTFVSEDKIDKIVSPIINHRLGTLLTNKNDNYHY